MLKIKVHNGQELAITGTDLIKAMQNKSTQLLDLLVRESIQNCLDAQDKEDCSRYVEVEFLTGDFESESFCSHLEEIDTISKNITEDGRYRYIAIRDLHTTGLTGPLSADEVENNEYGNLQKLIYQIFKNQTASGAGGAWGIGKTTYFRIGIGLVAYYSRILLDNGDYQSRMTVTLVEDSQRADRILHEKSKNPSGIAFWGNLTPSGAAMPITDEEEIISIVRDVFHCSLYEGNETGTTIIIPYIDENFLLHHNQMAYPAIASVGGQNNEEDNEEESLLLPWADNIDDYICLSAQRWYAPRLNNPGYIKHWNSKFLSVKVNGKRLTKGSMDPVFSIFQDLYNKAIGADSIGHSELDIKTETIIVKKQLENTESGTLAFVKLSRKDLGMQLWDKIVPAVTCNCDIETYNSNAPIVAYTRKPGMIVTYSDSNWTIALPHQDNNHFVLAMFVLNSNNTLKNTNYLLENYIREGEKSDHMMWEDCQFKDVTPKPSIVSKIQKGVKNKLNASLGQKDQDQEEEDSYNPASAILGDLLMPASTKDKVGSPDPGNSGGGTGNGNAKSCKYQYKVRPYQGHLYLDIIVKPLKGKTLSNLNCELVTESSGSPIKAKSWEEDTGLPIPVEIAEMTINTSKDVNVKAFPKTTPQFDSCYGHELRFDEDSVEIKISYRLKLNRRDVRPHILINND